MVDPDAYHGGSTSSPGEAFVVHAEQICSGLDDLLGTESVWDRFLYLDQWYAENTGNGVNIAKIDSGAQTLGARPFSADWINDFEVLNQDFGVESRVVAADEIQACFSLVTPMDPQSIIYESTPVFEPNASVVKTYAYNLAVSADDLYDFTNVLDQGDADSMPGFVRDLQQNGWSEGSLSSDSFFDFYDNLSLHTSRYAEAVYQLATTSALAGALIADYQDTLNQIAQSAHQEVLAALDYWQTTKAPAEATMSREAVDTLASKVAKGTAKAAGYVSKLPQARSAANAVKTVASITAIATQEYDITIESSQARSAMSIYDDLVEAVRKAKRGLREALDAVQTRDVGAGGSFGDYAEDSQGNGGWNPPPVEF